MVRPTAEREERVVVKEVEVEERETEETEAIKTKAMEITTAKTVCLGQQVMMTVPFLAELCLTDKKVGCKTESTLTHALTLWTSLNKGPISITLSQFKKVACCTRISLTQP